MSFSEIRNTSVSIKESMEMVTCCPFRVYDTSSR